MAAIAASPCKFKAMAIAALEVGSESETPISKPITGESVIVNACPWCDDCHMIHSIPRKNIETM